MVLIILGLLATVTVGRHAPARVHSNTSGIATQDFVQKINHAVDAGSATFKQRYQLNTRYFEPGGPILFIQSAESGMPVINASDFMDYALKLGGLVAMLEHRFFGDLNSGSYPPGYNPLNISNDSLSSLTLDNVLQDGVSFVNWIKGTVLGAKNSKVIYGGSSYGGFLAVLARIRHPDTFHGAIASSPALTSFGPLTSNRYKFDSAKWANDVYVGASKDAFTKIKASMLTFKKCVSDNTCDSATPGLNVCGNSTSLDYERLYRAVLQTYLGISKFNYPWVEMYPTADPLDDLIGKTLDAKTVGEVLRIPLVAASWTNDSSCIDAFNSNISKASSGEIANNQPAFGYIACGYYPINDRSIPSNNVLPETFARGNVDVCVNAAWKSADYGRDNEYFLQKYAMTNDLLDSTDRLLIVQGGYDRTAAIGSPILTVTNLLNHSRVILVDDIAHAEDAVSESIEHRGLKPQMDQIRDAKLAHLKEWLGRGNQAEDSENLASARYSISFVGSLSAIILSRREVGLRPLKADSGMATNSRAPLTEFTLFPALPTELRIKIWNESFQPRVVELHSQSFTDGVGEVPKWVSNCSNPAALSVCFEARMLARAHFSVLLPVFRSKLGEPILRGLYFDPASDLLAVLGQVEFMRLVDLFKAVRLQDPAGRGLQRFCLSMNSWTHSFHFEAQTHMIWHMAVFSQLEELVLLMYDEQRPPANFRDGECALEAVPGMDAFSRLFSANWRQLFDSAELRLMNLKFIPGPVSCGAAYTHLC
ncbi:serine carboxypeptidase S28-domain-containing protein [Annulohypoxylon bovei var. microspora]|nr:serine carboxypeptidase S28-domain-containing protein [Annulohypoxylon bovei var. microspora]